jgi:PAS domain S-box-containing protein
MLAGSELFEPALAGVRDYAVIVLEPDGRIASWNAGAELITGYAAEEIVGEHFSRFYTAEDIAARRPDRILRKAAARGQHTEECVHLRRDGSTYSANVLLSAIRTERGRLRGFTNIIRDVTERKRIIAQALDAAERQRLGIAARLHDGPVQALMTSVQDLQELRAATGGGSAAATKLLEHAAGLVELSIAQLREMIDIRPVMPATVNLDQELRLLVAEAETRGSISSRVRVDDRAASVHDRVTLAIVRELITNVVRHAQATRVSVDVRSTSSGATRITVKDDGMGLPPERIREALSEGHIGLALVGARAEALGGTFSVTAKPERGTTATVVLPPPQNSGST